MNAEESNGLQPAKRRVNRRIVAWCLLAGMILPVACVLVFQAYRRSHADTVAIPKKVETVQAQTGSIAQTVSASGKLTLFRYADVGTQIPGQIKEVYVSIGDMVKAGKLLLEIAPGAVTPRVESNRAQLARLQAELADQNAQFEFAQLQFQRQTRLMTDGATREENVDSSRMNMLSSAAKVDAIHAQVQQIEASIKEEDVIRQQTNVAAPMAGTIVSLSAHTGQMLNTSQNTLLRIADLSKMTVQARVAEKDVTRLRKGMTAYFTTPGFPGRRWSGKLSQIMPLPIEDSVQQGKQSFYTVSFDVANPEHELMSGMSAEVEFVLAQVENVVTIPVCLLRNAKALDAQILHVLEPGGKLVERKVMTGMRNAQQVQVVSGLLSGERIAVVNRPGVSECLRLENESGAR